MISERIGYLYTLSKDSENSIKEFQKRQSDTDLQSALEKFISYFHIETEPDMEAAKLAFHVEWKAITDAPGWQDVQGDFETCNVSIEELPALRETIADLDDFVFYLKHSDETESLLRSGLQDGKSSKQTEPGWSVEVVEAQLPVQLPSPGGFDFKARVSAVKPLEAEKRFSFDQELWLWDEAHGSVAKGRILACLCERGEKWSVSFRKTEKRVRDENKSRPDPCFLNTPDIIKDILWQTIFALDDSDQHGLVVIAGRTGSCKSQIAKALIETRLQSGSHEHVVTYEDPIERKIKSEGPNTAREKGKDVADLREATRNALRQKPAVLFVGETRDPEEWDMLLKYAGTGHLVVTTSHAGSLIEAMGNILLATQAHDPTARSVVGERLLAVVHLKAEKAASLVNPDSKVNILIPALWRRTPEGIKALMSEGLSSLVPNTPPRLPPNQEKMESFPSSIGRYWFARELIERKNDDHRLKAEDMKMVEKSALEWDLEGV